MDPSDRHTAVGARGGLVRALFGYPWRGTGDPRDQEFRPWVDGHPDLEATSHQLLRARQRALAARQPGRACDLEDELRSAGIVLRDRNGGPECRCTSASSR